VNKIAQKAFIVFPPMRSMKHQCAIDFRKLSGHPLATFEKQIPASNFEVCRDTEASQHPFELLSLQALLAELCRFLVEVCHSEMNC
jgi:hypothetical protein